MHSERFLDEKERCLRHLMGSGEMLTREEVEFLKSRDRKKEQEKMGKVQGSNMRFQVYGWTATHARSEVGQFSLQVVAASVAKHMAETDKLFLYVAYTVVDMETRDTLSVFPSK